MFVVAEWAIKHWRHFRKVVCILCVCKVWLDSHIMLVTAFGFLMSYTHILDKKHLFPKFFVAKTIQNKWQIQRSNSITWHHMTSQSITGHHRASQTITYHHRASHDITWWIMLIVSIDIFSCETKYLCINK